MKTQELVNTILLVVVAGLLVWNGMGARPAVVAAPPIPSEPTETGAIVVSGSSAIRVQPDRVVLVFGVETFAKTPSESQAQNARQAQAVIKALSAQDIAPQDIATAGFSIQPWYQDYTRNVIAGYGAHNTIAVTLRDVNKLETVLVAALEAGATNVDGIEFSVTNLRELRDQARDQAVRAALEKASAMASAAGMAVGDVINISESTGSSSSGGRQWTNTQNIVQELVTEGAITLEDGTIALGQIVVRAEVSLTAKLAPELDKVTG